jgi:phage terminase large subunit
VELTATKKQMEFINCTRDEVLFGGRAGGGKSYGQVLDGFIYALKYPKSKQLILRRTYPELEKSIIRTSLSLYPKNTVKYSSQAHVMNFYNGSIIDYGYCDGEKDIYRYQSAEFDVIRFDELTHFTENMYVYLISRLRGANSYPKQIKSTTNPGNIGHMWVKKRFVDIGEWGKEHKFATGSRIFLPAVVTDNKFLLDKDPGYLKRLENLSQKDKQALLYGNWDIFAGQFFSEWDRNIHATKKANFTPQSEYISMDYGLDMLAALFIQVSDDGRAFVKKEIYEPNLIASQAARKIKSETDSPINGIFAPPDLWNRRQDTGKSVAQIFNSCSLPLIKSNNNRVSGWLAVKEFLHPYKDEWGKLTAKLTVGENCTNLIRTLPALTHSDKNVSDVNLNPHEITHAPDALRYFCTMFSGGEKKVNMYTGLEGLLNLTVI